MRAVKSEPTSIPQPEPSKFRKLRNLLDSAETEGGRISNVRMADCNGGLVCQARGEYVIASNCVADNCTVDGQPAVATSLW